MSFFCKGEAGCRIVYEYPFQEESIKQVHEFHGPKDVARGFGELHYHIVVKYVCVRC
jgi:hypothetical protein